MGNLGDWRKRFGDFLRNSVGSIDHERHTQILRAICRQQRRTIEDLKNQLAAAEEASAYHVAGLMRQATELERHYSQLCREVEETGGPCAQRAQELERRCVLLEALASEDSLTRLLNRRGCQARTEAVINGLAHNQQGGGTPSKNIVTAIAFDLDHFKQVNDRCGGHAVGDQVLVTVAGVMRKHFARRASDILCRLGGDEFLIILPQMAMELAYQKAANFGADIRTDPQLQFPNQRVLVTVSTGIASVEVETKVTAEDTFVKLKQRADMALYVAKDRGGDCIVREDTLLG